MNQENLTNKFDTIEKQEEYIRRILDSIDYKTVTVKEFKDYDGIVVVRYDANTLAKELATLNEIEPELLLKLQNEGNSSRFHIKYRGSKESLTRQPIIIIQTNNSELEIEIPLHYSVNTVQ